MFCICGQNLLKVPVKEVNFSNATGLQHATLLKNLHLHKDFSRVSTPQVENSFVVQNAQHQLLLLEFIYLFIYLQLYLMLVMQYLQD